MEPVTAFVIRRSVWLRGDDDDSMLLRPSDERQCCLGIYLEACGVPRAMLRGVMAPHVLLHVHKAYDVRLPDWMTESNGTYCDLMEDNDNEALNETVREAVIRAGFAKLGITVTFED